MTEERNLRKVRQGVVVSDVNDKTIVVEVKERKPHPVYGKMMTTTKKFHAHDENNEAARAIPCYHGNPPSVQDEALAPCEDRREGQIARVRCMQAIFRK